MISYRKTCSVIDAFNAYHLVRHLNGSYPDFENWYVNKAIPDFVSRDGTLLLAEDKGQIVGIAIAKRGDQPKFRCMRVLDEYQGRGIGIHLTDRILRDIDCDKPLVTVSQSQFHFFSRIFVNRFDFDLSKVEKDLYLKGSLEYVFNGNLGEKSEY